MVRWVCVASLRDRSLRVDHPRIRPLVYTLANFFEKQRLDHYYDRFNYRATHHMVENGFYNFLNWFDERAWYPLDELSAER